MPSGKLFFKSLNFLFGLFCVAVGLFLPEIDAIYILQQPGEDAYRLIQIHWIAVGMISLFSARSNRNSQLWSVLAMIWLIVNGWLGAVALVQGDPKFSWVLVYPIVAFLNYFQLLAQDTLPIDEGDEPHQPDDVLKIPEDFYEVQVSSVHDMMKGFFWVVISVCAQLATVIGFFFYVTLMSRVIFEGASVDLSIIPEQLLKAFWEILYIPVIVVVVYWGLILIVALFEKLALSSGNSDDVNRSLALQERHFIQESLERLEAYLPKTDYPAWYGWLTWPSLIVMIGLFIGFPTLVVWGEGEFFNAVTLSGVPRETVISSMGPAFVGGVIFSFLFGASLYWAVMQWLGARYRRFGEYLHSQWGWNSMTAEARSMQSYAKIFTRFVRQRKYDTEEIVEPKDFIFDAFNEFGRIVHRSTLLLAMATIVFTALDVNWRRVVHSEGVHYSPYLDFRSFDLTFEDVAEVRLRCFLYGKNDDGVRKPGVGYDIVFKNGIVAYLLEGEIDPPLLDKVEAVDLRLWEAGVPFERTDRAGTFFLRGFKGYRRDCHSTVLTKFDPSIRDRIGSLIRADFVESTHKN